MGLFGGLMGGGSSGIDPKPIQDLYKERIGFYSPFGTVKTNKGVTSFSRGKSQIRQARSYMGAAGNKGINAIQSLPNQFDVNAMYNNPFYDSVRGQLYRSIDQRRGEQSHELDNDLNAKGLLGGSYDAQMRKNFNQDFNNQYTNADDLARQYSADAYNTSISNALNTANTLSGVRGQEMQNFYYPAQMGSTFTGQNIQRQSNLMDALTSLQQAQAQFNANKNNSQGGILQSLISAYAQMNA